MMCTNLDGVCVTRAALLIFFITKTLVVAENMDWQTKAEKSNFQETSRYDETIQYCKRLEQNSPWIRYSTFGKSPEGRDLPLLIASKNNRFTTKAASQSDDAIVLIINGIHSGEIAGKEASLMLLRDIAISKLKPALLDHVTLLVVPIFSVDGHERFGPYNRINQNGPKEMGWRTTSQNLNLNRDWMKADQPEMRAMLQLIREWNPDLVIDNHVSDGADYQYDVTYIVQDYEMMAEPVRNYWFNLMQPAMKKHLDETGHISDKYFELVDTNNLEAGIAVGPLEPRFSDSYMTLQNRLAMTVETHMLKDFKTRVLAHYDLMEGVLLEINREPGKIQSSMNEADQQAMKLGSHYDPGKKFAIRYKLDDKTSEIRTFKGIEFKIEQSSISGDKRVTYGKRPVDFKLPVFKKIIPEVEIAPPIAYLIPPQWTDVIDRLTAHGIELTRTSKPIDGKFETYRFSSPVWNSTPFEGRHTVQFQTIAVMEERSFVPGSVLVRLNQRTNKIIMGLLEPQASDSLVSWGFFSMIFENKEYAEPYVLEKLAEEMLKKDPSLHAEFEKKLESDSSFAASHEKRLDFFYQRSPYYDQRKNAYPIVRITSEDQLK